MTVMEISKYIEYVSAEGDRFADVAEQGDLDVAIEPCGDWDMRALVRHLGLIHLWAAGHVAFPTDDFLDADDIPDMARYWPELGAAWPSDDELVPWYRKTKANLVRVLAEAPDHHECFSFLPAPTPVTMWSRRQASEIAIHRFDAEDARGIASDFEPAFAADMLDELLSGFAAGPRATEGRIDLGGTKVLHVHATDVDEHWRLTIEDDEIVTTRDDGPADLTICGSASDLYLAMWNRADDSNLTLEGDPALLDYWREASRVRWSGGE